jgi:hypothetical protein
MNRANIKLLSLVAITIMFVACNPTIKTDTAPIFPNGRNKLSGIRFSPSVLAMVMMVKSNSRKY